METEQQGKTKKVVLMNSDFKTIDTLIEYLVFIKKEFYIYKIIGNWKSMFDYTATPVTMDEFYKNTDPMTEGSLKNGNEIHFEITDSDKGEIKCGVYNFQHIFPGVVLDKHFSTHNIDLRTDESFIAFVENYNYMNGENGWDIGIIKIPCDVDGWIEEDEDGYEHFIEDHRTWELDQ